MGLIKDLPVYKMLNRVKFISEGEAWMFAFKDDRALLLDIVKWIQERLKSTGEDSKGDVIGFYSRLTESINPSKKFNTHFTLFDEGDYYRSMSAIALLDAVVIRADDRKMKDSRWYKALNNPNDIIDLNEEEISKLADRVRSGYAKYIQKVIFKGG